MYDNIPENIQYTSLQCECNSQPLSIMCHENEELITAVYCDIHVPNNTSMCNVSIFSSRCIKDDTADITSKGTIDESPTSESVTAIESELTTDGALATDISRLCTASSPKSTIVVVLGAIAALLLVLLIAVTAALIWTCWLLMRKGEKSLNTDHQLR